MKYLFLTLIFFLTSCYSSTIYNPQWECTEAEVNIVFDRNGFRGAHGWGWQVGTLCFEYDRYKKWSIYGWPEEIDMMEEWFYIYTESIGGFVGPRITSPYR